MDTHHHADHASGGAPSHGHDEGHEAGHEHHGIGKYIAVFVALCVLTGCSFFTYSPLWPWRQQPEVGRSFMMAVSCTKAALVILFFMHLKYEASWKYVLTIPASMMSVLLALALVPDVGLRYYGFYSPSPERSARVASEADRAQMLEASHRMEQEHGHGATDGSHGAATTPAEHH